MIRTAIDITPQTRRVSAERLAKSLGYRPDGTQTEHHRVFINDTTGDRARLRFDRAGRYGTWSFYPTSP